MKDSTKLSMCYIMPFAWSLVQSLPISIGSVVSSLEGHRHKRETPEEKVRNLYKLIPEGCYGPKQLEDVIRYGFSKFTFKPVTPKWCTDNGFVMSDRLSAHGFATTAPPYQIHAYPFYESKNVFQIVLQSEESDANIDEAIMVARPVDERGVATYNNVGRFIKSEGVSLICCSLTDKDVARFVSERGGVKEVIFYWAANEEGFEDFEGNFIFVATVAKSQKEYWINVTSKIMYASSPTTRMLGDIRDNGYNKQNLDQSYTVIDLSESKAEEEQQNSTTLKPNQVVKVDEQGNTERNDYQIVDDERNDTVRDIRQIIDGEYYF